MLEISKDANKNYLAKIVKLKGLRKHGNADRLQVVDIDFQTVITGLDAKDGDVYVFFPLECAISSDYLSFTNSFREKEYNANVEKTGFFDKNGRVKAIKLRGEKSMGYIVPIQTVFDWVGAGLTNVDKHINKEFDVINGKSICKKYIVKVKDGGARNKQGKAPKVSRLIDGQVHLHVDTENLRKNVHKLCPDDIISVTYKTHGTSWWVSNVLVKKSLSRVEKILKYFGVNIVNTEYDLVYGSRKVVKNKSFDDAKQKDHYFGYDLWEDIKDEVGESIPKGFTLYGEMLGYDKNGGAIQKHFDYGCDPHGALKVFCDNEILKPKHKVEVYRITFTNEDGVVFELTYNQIAEFCEKAGLKVSTLFYYGKAGDMYKDIDTDNHWNENFLRKLEQDYNEKDCFMCFNKVPEEGIVVRKEKLNSCESYKLKSFRFLEFETKQLDKGESDIESEN